MQSTTPLLITLTALLALTFSGCINDPDTPVNSGHSIATSRTDPIQFVCTQAPLQAGEACAGTSSTEGDQWAEPYVLAHPQRDVFVISSQGDASPLPQEGLPRLGVLDEAGPTCGQRVNCLFTTEDQGATWRRQPAIADDGTTLYVDSTMAWSDDVLLVAGLVPNSGGIGVLRSEDDGRSFPDAFVFSEAESDDRPWISAQGSEVALVWQESGAFRGFLKLSHDGGKSWSEAMVLPCNVFSRPVWSGTWWIACGSESGTQVYEVAERPELRAEFGDGGGTRMLAKTPLGYALATATTGALRYSPDGTNWTEPMDLLPDVEDSDSWLGWMTTYRDGVVAIAWDAQGGCRFCADSEISRELVHVDAAHASLRVDLTPTSGWAFEGQGPRSFGEFDGIDCAALCLAAWPDEGRLTHVFFRP